MAEPYENPQPCNIIQTITPDVSFPDVTWRQDILLPEPVLLLPRPNAVFCLDSLPASSSNVALTWFPVTDATHYLVQWANNPQVSGPTVKESIVTTTVYPLIRGNDIRLGETIYWRVQAANLTTGGISPRSEIRSLTYNCGNQNLNQLSKCASFDVSMELRGADNLVGFDTSTFWLEVSFSSEDNVGRQICCVSEVNWEIQQVPGIPVAEISEIGNNGFKIILKTFESQSQVINIRATVTFRDLINDECFECWAEKLVIVDTERKQRPIIKFKLKEPLPSCENAIAVQVIEAPASASSTSGSSGCGCATLTEVDPPADTGSDQNSFCCDEGDELVIYDGIGKAGIERGAGHSYAPEGSVGYAVWGCDRWEVLEIASGCCDVSSESSTENCAVTVSTYDVRCEDEILKKYVKVTSISANGFGCLQSEETDWIIVDSNMGCCTCCNSGSDIVYCPDCIELNALPISSGVYFEPYTDASYDIYFADVVGCYDGMRFDLGISTDTGYEVGFCDEDTKRFTVTFTNQSQPDGGTWENGRLGLAPYGGCSAPLPPASGAIFPGVMLSGSNLTITASSDPLRFFGYLGSFGPVTLPYTLSSMAITDFAYMLFDVCEVLDVSESREFWIDVTWNDPGTLTNRHAHLGGLAVGLGNRICVDGTYSGNCSGCVSALPVGSFPALFYFCNANAVGACCVDGDCTLTTSAACTGDYQGDGTFCVDTTCPTTGRCCKDGVCTVTTEAACTGIGGTWTAGADCSGPPCPI